MPAGQWRRSVASEGVERSQVAEAGEQRANPKGTACTARHAKARCGGFGFIFWHFQDDFIVDVQHYIVQPAQGVAQQVVSDTRLSRLTILGID